ncbi:hypothetical protein AX774_g772, partial [Zancudomyces culisetae]
MESRMGSAELGMDSMEYVNNQEINEQYYYYQPQQQGQQNQQQQQQQSRQVMYHGQYSGIYGAGAGAGNRVVGAKDRMDQKGYDMFGGYGRPAFYGGAKHVMELEGMGARAVSMVDMRDIKTPGAGAGAGALGSEWRQGAAGEVGGGVSGLGGSGNGGFFESFQSQPGTPQRKSPLGFAEKAALNKSVPSSRRNSQELYGGLWEEIGAFTLGDSIRATPPSAATATNNNCVGMGRMGSGGSTATLKGNVGANVASAGGANVAAGGSGVIGGRRAEFFI